MGHSTVEMGYNKSNICNDKSLIHFKKKTTMKKLLLLIFAGVAIFFASCKKEDLTPKTAQVKVKIDYLGSGGYYNDNIDGVPSGLVIGTNGPYTADPAKQYTLEYKANSNFGVATITGWSPTAGKTWVIHCYVSGNIAHIETYPE
jgi:hypothetical protein